MILLAPHTDTVFNNPKIAYENGQHIGLLDNFIGVLCTYLTLYQHEAIRALEQDGELKIYHNRGEEYGYLLDPPDLDPGEDLVIVVDVCAGDHYQDIDVSFENIWNFPDIDETIAELRREGYRIAQRPYTGDPADTDEAFAWIEKGIPVLSFIIPIQAKENNWHRIACDNTVAATVVAKAANCLARFISHLI
ncbi:MAG: hypothetical protein JST36_01075 [Bacteroidetes bacterium]|nr:hypothetical protein [Bacteroidota bacterium]